MSSSTSPRGGSESAAVPPERSLRDVMRVRHASLSAFRRAAALETSLEKVLSEAIAVTMTTISPDRCALCERSGPAGDLLIRCGEGWLLGVVGSAKLSGAPETLGGYTLLHDGAVVVEDLRKFPQFTADVVLTGHQVVSALTLPVRGQQGPLGLLGVFSSKRRLFGPDDAEFLQGVADALAAAIYRAEWAQHLTKLPRRRTVIPTEWET